MFVFILLSAAAMIWIEVPALIQRKSWKELAVFSGFLLAGISLGVILVFHLPFPNPAKGIEVVFKPVTKWLSQGK
ncbi:hypothetical protein ACX1C1_15990 [Paenibacillus sp. strain BS8-2]